MRILRYGASLFGVAAVVCTAGTANAAINFTTGTSLATALRPSGAAIGDFNGDNRNDLAVTADTQDRIILFFGNGDGTFGGPQNILTGGGTGPEGLAAADVDRDGDMDLVVVLHNANSVRAYINNGSGVFAAGSSVATGADPRGPMAADLDGDGDLDFATANRDGNSITVIRNNAGTLALGVTMASGGAEPRFVAAGDFNGNGTVDLAVSNHDSRSITILSASAPFAYALSATLPVPPSSRPDGIAAGDLDGDGDIDLAASVSDEPNFNVVSVYTNNGGTFGGPTNFPTGGVNPSFLLLADLDLDGRLDAAVAHEDSGNISVLQNVGGRGAAITFGAPMVFATGGHPEQIAAGDLDGNRTPDLAVPNRDSNTTSILLNATTPPPPACRADFDGSGVLNSQDFFGFLGAFFVFSPQADFNQNGAVNSQDLFDFIGAFFAGC